ncbi:hypothetical protein [Micromonospora chersina]
MHDPAWDPDAEPEAVIERTGRWWHLVYIRHGLMRSGPGGYGWHVLGASRAERKARRVLAAYLRRQGYEREARVIRAVRESEGQR